MPTPFSEVAVVERPALELLAELGWTVVSAREEAFGPAGTLGRDSTAHAALESGDSAAYSSARALAF